MNKFYLTTPIYYINDLPHLGHYYTTLAADVLARYHRLKGDDVFFATGTDENSLKIIQAAQKVNLSLSDYTNQMAKKWQETWDALDISYTDFIRTTETRHLKAVEKFINKVYKSGDIYQGKYEGLYCLGCENYKGAEDLIDGLCPDHQTAPQNKVEENYFFALSKYQEKLLAYYEQNDDFAAPSGQRSEMISFIQRNLKDVSISRLGIEWGIPLPFDKKQVIWVWFDALINYLSVLDYGGDEKKFNKFWPADLHLVGRDIFRFHAVLWPAMLMSADLPLPKKIFAHGFFTVNSQKMSKTLGNVINPLALVKKFGADGSRYLILSVFPFGQDGDINEEKLKEKYNADLANGLGNLISRVFNLIEKNFEGQISLASKSPRDLSIVNKKIEALEFDGALREIWDAINWANQYIDEQKLWNLTKEDKERGGKILADLIALIAEIAQKLEPFMPVMSRKIIEALKAPNIQKGEPLFPRI